MNFESVKKWFANVDISHTDWRVRWPLMLLPFLLLGMVFSLLSANRLSGEYNAQGLALQTLMQKTEASVLTQTQAQDTAQVPLEFRASIGQFEDRARVLQEWLLQGRNTQSQAQHASALIELTTQFQNSAASMPGMEWWDSISALIANLENSVDEGLVATPEARDIIQTLRQQYAQLRTNSLVTSAADGSDVVPDTQQASDKNELSAGFEKLQTARARITRLQNRALIFAVLSCALFGLLLWGLWRATQNKQLVDAGKERVEQGAILRLLDEISPLADGDLRVRATVSEASTGAVADAFNYAVDELRRLVLAVTDSADLVKTSVGETRESAHQLAKASSVQSREIHRSSNYLNVMSDTMAQLSAHAVESSHIADLSVQQARSGGLAVQENVDGLHRIREQAEMTSRLMQRLVDTSAQIHERVSAIESVAKRTDLLALNTTIRSAAQASHGGTESVSQLSYDVAHLADTLGRATRDIANLSNLIQRDATITLESMSNTVAVVDENQLTAESARKNLTEIDRVSNQLNELIADIASKSLRQAGVVKQLSSNMGVINNITRESATELQASAKALEKLQEITADLRDSVSDFKLPVKEASNRVRKKIARKPVTHA